MKNINHILTNSFSKNSVNFSVSNFILSVFLFELKSYIDIIYNASSNPNRSISLYTDFY